MSMIGLKRRAHRKSRGGCKECKRRRIKCDEGKPQCLHCVRHDISCVYPSIADPRTNLSQNEYPSPQSDTSSKIVGQTSSPTILPHVDNDVSGADLSQSLFEVKDLALLHHWTIATSRSILDTPGLNDVWQTVLPVLGFQSPSLVHSILSLAALHVAYLNPLDRHQLLYDAARHHNKALQGFREGINHIGPENSDSLFANAILCFFYAFLTFGKLYDSDDEDTSNTARISRVLGAEWIPLVRGIEAVLHPVYNYVRIGSLNSLLSIGNWEELDPDAFPDSDDDQILKIQETWNGKEHAKVYDETLYLLRKCRVWMEQFQNQQEHTEMSWGYNRDWSGPFIWLFSVPEEYITLQKQRQPPALVIFAHFGALLQRLNEHWWIEGCGRSIVETVDHCLGPYWNSTLSWPKKIVGLV